ncbi:MAG: hypothetical protein A3K83_01625 [Omnitrophica WOR_2 bacterium RBG_13_44_8b]|nr:MAG: hypothetical protein A3K83_01625 [Omnitrophica WOR_2 bacterium RBG_13_44_8b]
MSNESPKIEFFADNGIIEVRYFDNPKDHLYRSWKLPEAVAAELIAWWARLMKDNQIAFPLEKKSKSCQFTMYTEKYIEIKSLDCRGRTNMTGWSLPAVVIEKLVVLQKDTVESR